MKNKSYEFLAITENGLAELEALREMLLTTDASDIPIVLGGLLEDEGETEDDSSDLYNLQEGVAIIDMKGPMVQNRNWVSDWMGFSTYEGLRESFITALNDPEVTAVMVDSDTPGGTVSGVSELGALISTVNKTKEVTFYTGGQLSSAGYWLASAGSEIQATKAADVGSIGVIVNHLSYEEAMKKEGIKFTQIKSGEKKAVGSPYKNLTDSEEAQIQVKVDDLFGLFRDHVNAERPQVSPEVFNGDTFLGYKALSLGLVDKLASFDDAFFAITRKNEQEETMPKHVLTAEQQLAATASGAVLEDEVVEEELTSTEAEVEADIEVEAHAEVEASTEAEETETEDGDEEEFAHAEGEVLSDPLTSFLENKLSAVEAEVSNLKLENSKLIDAAKETEDTFEGLKGIAIKAITNMRIPLGLTSVDMTEMSAEAIIKEHAALSKSFAKSFKIGGVQPGDEALTDNTRSKATITRIEEARCASVGLSK